MVSRSNGVEFERFVLDIQSRIDPNSRATHNEMLVNRLGHKRQFDVVIRGSCAGVDFLGVVECKDLNRKVGCELVDAFITKANDINANFKILVSRKGFTKGAMEAARHYGVQTFSLLPGNDSSDGFFVGHKWIAEIYRWAGCNVRLIPVEGEVIEDAYALENIKIQGSRVFEWFSTYLNKNHGVERDLGWKGFELMFSKPQSVEISEGRYVNCSGMELAADRVICRKQRHVGISGPGFYDWQNGQIKVPPGSTMTTFPISTDFDAWEDAIDEPGVGPAVMFKVILHGSTKEFDGLIDMEGL